jgi:hypothetical protein
MWIGCYDWSARKILWVAWTWNALVQTIWGLLAVVQGQKISKLYDTFEENDRTSANLVTGIVATCAWAVVLIGLFLIFSLVVLLRKVRVLCGFREKNPERRARPSVARQPTRATPTSKTNANVERAPRKHIFTPNETITHTDHRQDGRGFLLRSDRGVRHPHVLRAGRSGRVVVLARAVAERPRRRGLDGQR